MLKWKLMVSTLPVVLALLGLKLFLERVLGFEGLIDFSDVGIILTSGVFLIGFLLAGTMADYKEAEKLPADLAGLRRAATAAGAIRRTGEHLHAATHQGRRQPVRLQGGRPGPELGRGRAVSSRRVPRAAGSARRSRR